MPTIGQRTELFPLPRNEERLVRLKEAAASTALIHAVIDSGACATRDASALRTRGATRVPSSSIARRSLACGKAATLIWKVRRDMQPDDSSTSRIFSATLSGS